MVVLKSKGDGSETEWCVDLTQNPLKNDAPRMIYHYFLFQ